MKPENLKPQLNRPAPSLFALLIAAAVLVLSGSAAFAEIAPFGNSYDLTGNPLAIPANAAYSSWPLTVECRVKLDRQDKYNIIIANETKASPRHWEFYTAPGGNFAAYLPGFTPALFDTGIRITDGQWHALAMIVEESRVRLFVDGELKKDMTVTAPSAPALGQGLMLGGLVEGGMDCAGQIDEVRIAKCVGPISGVAAAPFIKNADTVGLWQFEEKTASVAKAALKPATTSLDMTPTGTSCDLTLGPATISPNAAYSSWPLTVECRIKLMPKNTFSVIIANETKASPRHWELYATPGNGNLCAYLPGFTPSSFNTTVSVADGQWHALAMVVEETRVRLFVDGKLIQEQAVAAPSAPALGQPLRLGALVEGGFDCTGQIDEVRISKGTRPVSGLSGAAITDDDSTVGLWQFEDNTPGVARDASKLKNDARLPPPDLGSLFKATLDFSKGMASIPVDADFEQRPLTIDCWVKIAQTDSDPQAAFRSVLLSYGNLNDVADQGHWNLVTGPRPWFSMPGRCGIIAKTPIQDNKWHHLALVLESNQARIFVDGIEEAKGDILPAEPAADCPSCGPVKTLTIGGLPDGLRRVGGEMGELRITSGIRIPAGVSMPLLAADDQTLGLWRFDFSDKNDFTDVSKSKRNARFKATPLPSPTDYLALPKKPDAEPLRKVAATLATQLGLSSVNPANVTDEVWQQWHFDFHGYGKFDYDRGPYYWKPKDVNSQVFDTNTLILPEDAGPPSPFTKDADTIGLWQFDEKKPGEVCDLTAGPVSVATDPAYSSWPLTVECRVKLDRKDKYNIILANETKASPRHWELFTAPGSGNLSAYLPGFKPASFDAGVSVVDGQWHSVTMIVEAARIQLFVDGELKTEQAVAAPSAPALGQELKLGALVEGGMDCTGQIDDLRISKCVRSSARGVPAGTVLRQTKALIANLRQTATNDQQRKKLDALASDLDKVATAWGMASAEKKRGIDYYLATCMIRRQVAFSNPLLDFDSILCVARGTFAGSARSNPQNTDKQGGHFTTQYFGFNALPGGGLYIVNNWKTKPNVVDVLENSVVQNGRLKGQKLDHGAFCTPDLSYDGKTILFAWTANSDHTWSYSQERAWHLFKVNVDGSELTQITDGAYDDFNPCWLPDGRIAFISTRRGGHIRCFNPLKVRNYTLFSMSSDGSDIIPLSYYETSEWNPSVNNDGMLVYTRWDYTDRENCLGSRFWISGPDGSDPRAPHGNYPLPYETFKGYTPWKGTAEGARDSRSGTPMAEMGIRAIPGSHKYIFTGAPHHGEVYGSLGILDLRIEDDSHMSQIKRLTPAEPFPETENQLRHHYKYGTPWPLSEDFYLCNIWNNLALLDRFGNEELVCDLRSIPDRPDERLRLINPIPLRARPLPPVIPSRTNQGAEAQAHAPKATVSVMNVYDSDLPFPKDRKVKWLRIVQNILKTNHVMGGPMIGYERENTPRIPLGIVPVEEDGSVYFEAPIAKELILQPLDENHMAIQSMRTVAFVHPGEQLSCQGCHEPNNQSPSLASPPLAMKRAPSKLQPEIGPIEPISYYRQIKPIFDNNCVGCHKEKGKGPTDMSYEALKEDTFWFAGAMLFNMTTPYSGIHGGSRAIPGRFGAAYCNIGRALMDDTHRSVVSAEDRHKIIVWLDCNSLRLSAYIREDEQLQGKLVWPTLDVDPANPQGIEGTEPGLKHNFWHENLYGPHALLGTSHELQKIYLMNAKGEIVWDYPAINPQDVWMLPNGNILMTCMHSVKEVTRDKKVVWEFTVEAPNEVPTCQPLPNGNVLIGIVGQCRLVEVDRQGRIVHEVQLATTVKEPHAQFRMCRQTPEGTYLVPFTAEGAVREYSRDGQMLREFPRQGAPICAVRLPDGHTLITADRHVTEYDKNNGIVWQMMPEDVPDINLGVLAGVQRLSNGNTLVCNWNAKPEGSKSGAHIFELTPDKRVVWQVDTHAIGKVAQCQLLTDDLMPRDEDNWR